MPAELLAVAYAARSPERLAAFWSSLLDREPIRTGQGVLVPGGDGQLGLRFDESELPRIGPDRMHLHLTSDGLDHQHDIVTRALSLGASHLYVGQRPEEGHIVLADPEGYAFCVIEPGNAYLEGCGPLGELNGEGTREVGLFWSAALGWPLVWDQHEETAIQSPLGGTKVSWSGPPVAPRLGPDRQRLVLTIAAADRDKELERLVHLGASTLRSAEATVVLVDVDGTEFILTAL